METSVRIETPWGYTWCTCDKGNGILYFSTPSYAGFRCEKQKYLEACHKCHVPVKQFTENDDDQYIWFEDDVEWAYLVIAVPESFSKQKYREACNILNIKKIFNGKIVQFY